MRWLLSFPEESIDYFKTIYREENLEVASDPEGKNVGSGGAVCYLMERFSNLPGGEPTIIINGGGESRRLPAYSAYGKALLPLPVMKWSRGQKVDQRLLDLQREYLQVVARKAPKSLKTIVASGDAYIDLPAQLPPIPEADVVCLGLWTTTEVATRHGVFVTPRERPSRLLRMLQKPSLEVLAKEAEEHLLLVDSGVWLLSDKALSVLKELVAKSKNGYFDLYSDFGKLLGDEGELNLSSAVWVVDNAEFYHFGTTRELLDATYKLQNRVLNQREWLSSRWKKHGTIFAQSSLVELEFGQKHENIWIENSHLPKSWQLTSHHVITGIPMNNWELSLPEGICIDLVPLKGGDNCFALRLYHYDDTFKDNSWLGEKLPEDGIDIYDRPLFPTLNSVDEVPEVLEMILSRRISLTTENALSARQLLTQIDLPRIEEQRKSYLQQNFQAMRRNSGSVFFQSDLHHTAQIYREEPEESTELLSPITDIHDQMFRYEWNRLRGKSGEKYYDSAKKNLASLIASSQETKLLSHPSSLHHDQIVWARSPVRIDLAGGWTDTPPYCLFEGGGVVNFALRINGQEPLQAYVKRSDKEQIILRSIDLGATEIVNSTSELYNFAKPGSPFAIPKAALVLCGVAQKDDAWNRVLERMGGGLEITLLSALPAGSGLGTSSILSATILAALSEYFNLNWEKPVLGEKTLLLEQMLTTGGGWQDQYGGLYGGAKYITTERGLTQSPKVEWLPDNLFSSPEYAHNHLLFYTGQTRMAKNILSNIVDKVLLNEGETLCQLREIRELATEIAQAISHANLIEYGRLLKASWEANKRLDPGTSTPEIEKMIQLIDDYSLGYKLPGAGGGGFLYILAKDEVATSHIRKILTESRNTLPSTSRFVDISFSPNGLQVTKS